MKRQVCLSVFAVVLTLIGTAASAQDYPSRTITVIVPYGNGSPTEQEARLFGAHLERSLKRSVIIENKPGAGGSIGALAVARAEPDGHTLLYIGAAIATFKVLIKDLPFDPLKDLAPVSLVANFDSLFITSNQTPFTMFEQLAAYAKANPGKLNYGSAGRNTTMLKMEALLRASGLRLTEIPYAGESQFLTALVRNDVQFSSATLRSIRGQIEAGQLRPLIFLREKRHPLYPNVPSTGEKGWFIPDNGWNGLFAPAGTPRAIIDRLATEASRYTSDPEVKKRGAQNGVDYIGLPSEQFRQRIEAEARAWAEVANAVGLKPE